MNQHDDEPRRSSGGYVPFMPGQGPRPNRAQRRAKDQIRARGRRRMERATVRALKQAQRQDLRPQLSEDMAEGSVTVSVDLEETPRDPRHGHPRTDLGPPSGPCER